MRITVYPRTEQDIHHGLQQVRITKGNRVTHYNVYIRLAPYNDVCHVYSHHDRQTKDRWGDKRTDFVTRKLDLNGPLARQIIAAVEAAKARAEA